MVKVTLASDTQVYIFTLLCYLAFFFLAIDIFYTLFCQLFMLHIFSTSMRFFFPLVYNEETNVLNFNGIKFISCISMVIALYKFLKRKDTLIFFKTYLKAYTSILFKLMFLDSIICSVGQYICPLNQMLYSFISIRSLNIRKGKAPLPGLLKILLISTNALLTS